MFIDGKERGLDYQLWPDQPALMHLRSLRCRERIMSDAPNRLSVLLVSAG